MDKRGTKYTHGRTCVYNINYHIIWGIKHRNKWMTVALEDEIKQILHDTYLSQHHQNYRLQRW